MHPDSPAWAGEAQESNNARAKTAARENKSVAFIFLLLGLCGHSSGDRSSARRTPNVDFLLGREDKGAPSLCQFQANSGGIYTKTDSLRQGHKACAYSLNSTILM